ncbi:MAG: MBL fold metallo-hydrolase [Patescibacteria group bacterium]
MIKFSNFVRFNKSVRLGILLFIGIVIVLIVIVFVDLFDKSLRVSFYDIGQGDAVFIETPENYQILIDGGPGPLILRKLGRDMVFWDKTIDLVIATHPDADHISGLIDVLERYNVKNILISPSLDKDTEVFKVFYKAIWNEGAMLYLAEAGQSFSGILTKSKSNEQSENYIDFQVLYPFNFTNNIYTEDFNDMSIVNLLEYKGQKILFTADATIKVENMLLEKYPSLDINILKAGHHGSKTSSSFNFLKAITPDLAIIQVGLDNRYKHPHQSVIERFQNLGIPIWRTDLDGDLRLQF